MGSASVVYIGASFLNRISKIVLIIVFVRLLSTAEIGALLFVEAIALAVSRFLGFGLGQAARRFYIDYEDTAQADSFVAGIWWVSFLISLVAGVVLTVGASALGESLTAQVGTQLLLLAIVSGVLQSNFGVAQQRHVVRREPMKYAVLQVLPPIMIGVCAAAVLLTRGGGVRAVLLTEIAVFAFWNLALAVSITRLRPRFHWTEIRAAWRYAAPVFPHALFTWGLTFSDRLILERYVSLSALGVYGVGYSLASPLSFVALGVVNAWLPSYFRNAKRGDAAGGFRRVATTMCLLLAGLGTAIFLFAPEGVALVASADYLGAIDIVRIVTLGLALFGVYQALLLPLFFRKMPGLVSGVTAAALAVNVGLNLLLIPRFGITAAAWTTVAAYATAAAVAGVLVSAQYGAPLDWSRLLRGALITLVVVALGTVMGHAVTVAGVTFKCALFAAWCAAVYWLPGVLQPSERTALAAHARRLAGRIIPAGSSPPGGTGHSELQRSDEHHR
jgi:O-antigen/teichoic acid export membrane protein